MSDTTIPVAEMSFEQAMSALEVIVQQLESGDVDLEKSIAIYERGAELKAHCEGRLREAEARIEQIVQKSDGSIGSKRAEFSN